MDQRICVSYKRLSGPWMSPTMHHPHHPVLPGGGGDGWCRRHSSTMVTRHYVLWVQQCPRLCTVVSSTVWMTVRGGGRRCVGFGWAKQQVPSPWGENQFKPQRLPPPSGGGPKRHPRPPHQPLFHRGWQRRRIRKQSAASFFWGHTEGPAPRLPNRTHTEVLIPQKGWITGAKRRQQTEPNTPAISWLHMDLPRK